MSKTIWPNTSPLQRQRNEHQVLTVSYLSFVRIRYKPSTTWVMCHVCSFKTGAFANLSVVMNRLLTSSGIWGLQLRVLISKNSMLNADVSIIHLFSYEVTGWGRAWLCQVRRHHDSYCRPLPKSWTVESLFISSCFCFLFVCAFFSHCHSEPDTYERLPE